MNWGLGIEHEFFLSLEKTVSFELLKEYFNIDNYKLDKNIKDDTQFKILFSYNEDDIDQFITQNMSSYKKIDNNIFYFLFENNQNDVVKKYNLLTKKVDNVIDQLIKLFFPFIFYYKGINKIDKEKVKKLNKEFYPEICEYLSSSKKHNNKEKNEFLNLLIREINDNDKFRDYVSERNHIFEIFPEKYEDYKYGKNFYYFSINYKGYDNIDYINNIKNLLYHIYNSSFKPDGITRNILEKDYHTIGPMFEMKSDKYKNIKFNDFKNNFINNHKKLLNYFQLMMYSKYSKLIRVGGKLEIEKKSFINENFCVLTIDNMSIHYNKSKNDRYYLGSYHFWFTPCYTNNYFNTIEPWFKNLKNFARWLQWIEPLITIFFDDNNNKNESKVSYRDIVNNYGGYGTFNTDIMNISSKGYNDILLNKPPFKTKIRDLKIIKPLKPIEINPLFIRGKEYQLYFPSKQMINNMDARQVHANYFLPETNTYIDKLVNNKIIAKSPYLYYKYLGADIRLGNMNNNFVKNDLNVAYKEKNQHGYNLYRAEYKKDDVSVKRITSLKQLNIPKELIGFEFRVLDNMSLDKIFIIYHFCLLGMEMIRLTDAEFINAPKTKEWNNLMYRLMKEGKDIKIKGEAKKYFEKLFKIKLSNNFRDWFYEYLEYLYNNYNDKSIILN